MIGDRVSTFAQAQIEMSKPCLLSGVHFPQWIQNTLSRHCITLLYCIIAILFAGFHMQE